MLIANHVSFVDALIIGGCVTRPVRFVMYYKLYSIPIINFVIRTARAILIAGRKEDRAMYDRAFVVLQEAVDAGEILCVFPEGRITYDGTIDSFKLPGFYVSYSKYKK